MAPAGPPRRHRSKHLDEYLATHNRLADLTSFLIRMAIALGHRYTVEQPVSSLLFSYSPIACVAHNADSVSFCMGYFAGNTLKPLRIVGTASWLHVFRDVYLRRKKTCAKPTEKLARTDKSGFTGIKRKLDESSAYTAVFGRCVALCHQGLFVMKKDRQVTPMVIPQ